MGINSYAVNTFPEYDPVNNPVREVFSFQIDTVPDPVVLNGINVVADGQVAPVNFGIVNVQSTTTHDLTIRNDGLADLLISATNIDGTNSGEFTVITAPSGTLAPGATTTLTVQFAPLASGTRTASLHILSNAAGDKASYDIALSGMGNDRPQLTLPTSPVITEATSPAGAMVNFTVTATDPEDGPLTPDVNPASGSTFPLGDTTVNVSATDSHGLTTMGSFLVRVQDTTAPGVGAPVGGFTPLTLQSGDALPSYTSQAVTSDAVGVVNVTQSPVAGTTVGTGVVHVTVNAFDAAGNMGTTGFDVNVTAGSTTYSNLVNTGEGVPGAGTDSRIVSGSLWTSLGTPALDDFGHLAFVGKWVGPKSSGNGIFGGKPVALVAAHLEVAPETGGAVFSAFKDPVLDRGAGASGAVAFMASLTKPSLHSPLVINSSNSTGIWANTGGTVKLVARAGQIAPGSGGGTGGADAATFKKFVSFSLVDGEVLISAQLTAGVAGVATGNSLGVWRWTVEGGLQLVLHQGQSVPTSTGPKTVSAFQILETVAGSPGHGRHHLAAALYEMRVACSDKSLIDYAVDASSGTPVFTPIAETGAAIPPGLTAKSLGVPAGNPSGEAAFTATFATFKGGPATTNNVAVILDRGATVEIVARKGDAVDSVSKWGTFKDPVLNKNGDLAWVGTVSGSSSATKTILASRASGGQPQIVARSGTAAPDTDGGMFSGFTSVALPDDSTTPVFVASMLTKTPSAGPGLPATAPGPGGVTTANDTGLWAVDSSGALHLLLREGQTLSSKVVKSFVVLANVPGSPGESRSFNSHRQVLVKVTFDDKSMTLLQIGIP